MFAYTCHFRRAGGRPTTLAGPGSPIRYTRHNGYVCRDEGQRAMFAIYRIALASRLANDTLTRIGLEPATSAAALASQAMKQI